MLTIKERGGGGHFLLYLSRLLFFRAETSWLFFLQAEKLHTNRVFVFRIHFHYVLSYLFGLFGVRTCVSILWHTSLPKNATLLEKIAKNHDFGDFWWFSCFWHDVTYDVTVASYKVCLYFFWYQWTREGHSYPLVPHTWYFVNRFPRSWGGAESALPPRLWDGSKKPGSFRVKLVTWYVNIISIFLFVSRGNSCGNRIFLRFYDTNRFLLILCVWLSVTVKIFKISRARLWRHTKTDGIFCINGKKRPIAIHR